MRDKPTFELGLVLAGAISAGAYTAGVIDFLTEALDAYEEEKRKPGWDGPTHDVKIPVMAGASAGGAVAAIAALQLFHDIEHVQPGAAKPAPERNRLYSSWVKDISIERFLEISDLDGTRGPVTGVRSALCCTVLEDIVERAFKLSGAPRQRRWVGRGPSDNLRLICTLTNLRGVPYSFAVFGDDGNERYGMLNHRDDLEFSVGFSRPSPEELRGAHWLNIRQTSDNSWELLRSTALATAAFPGNLAPRLITRPIRDYLDNGHVGAERRSRKFEQIPPSIPRDAHGSYSFVGVDGGAMDNEPFELARRHLAGGADKRNERDGKCADRAMLLVDPFPNYESLPPPDPDEHVISTLPRLFGALKDQARFKPEELALAADPQVFSRFMMAPVREDGSKENAIACGVLGGFGGFLHESFRRHDYLLGRRNAQAFLRWSFALPETNRLFQDFDDEKAKERWCVRDPHGRKGDIGARVDRSLPFKRFAERAGSNSQQRGLPIIPLTEKLREPIVIGAEDWPRPDLIDLDNLCMRMETRANKVYSTVLSNELSSLGRLGRWATSRFVKSVAIPQSLDWAIDKLKDVQAEVAAAFPKTPPIVQPTPLPSAFRALPINKQSTSRSFSVMENRIIHKWRFWSSIIVQEGERALVYRNGCLVAYLRPGRWFRLTLWGDRTLWGIYRVEVINVNGNELSSDQLMLIQNSDGAIKEDILKDILILRTSENQIKIIHINKKLHDIVQPNDIRAFWNTNNSAIATDVTVDTALVPNAHRKEIELIGTASNRITVAPHELAVLTVNGAPQQDLPVGAYTYWICGPDIQIIRMDRNPQPLEVIGHETLTKDGKKIKITAIITYQIYDASLLMTNTNNEANWLRRLILIEIARISETYTFNQIVAERESLDEQIKERLAEIVESAGILINDICIEGVSPRPVHGNGLAASMEEEGAQASL